MSETSDTPTVLSQTPLYALHAAHGARMVAFAGYHMPLQYAAGVLREHLHARSAAGLFDVSHMGQISVRPRSGRLADAALALERLVPVDILSLAPGRQRYAVFTAENGGVLDDLMIVHRGDHYLLIVNAATKEADEAHLVRHLAHFCDVARLDRALIALQGPKAEAVLARLAADAAHLKFMDVGALDILGAPCIISRSGYTGEDGFEISLPAERAADVAETLLEDASVALIGLGARDSLRLEAGLCLYGSDLDATTTPVEADLTWAIQPVRRRGGARAGEFAGADVILDQIERGAGRRRTGLLPQGRTPVRSGAPLFTSKEAAEPIGTVTSGGFAPSLDRPVAMGYVPSALSLVGTVLFAEVREQRLPVTVTALPFVPSRFKRGPFRRPSLSQSSQGDLS